MAYAWTQRTWAEYVRQNKLDPNAPMPCLINDRLTSALILSAQLTKAIHNIHEDSSKEVKQALHNTVARLTFELALIMRATGGDLEQAVESELEELERVKSKLPEPPPAPIHPPDFMPQSY